MKTKELLKLVLDLSNRLESVERKLGLERLSRRPAKDRKRDPRPVQDEVTPPKYEEEVVEEYDLDVHKVPLMSNTELVQVCRAMGAKEATRQLPREELLTAILEDKIPNILDPLQEIRSSIYEYISEKNSTMLASIQNQHCSMHCPTCPHHKVVDCWSDNKDIVAPEA